MRPPTQPTITEDELRARLRRAMGEFSPLAASPKRFERREPGGQQLPGRHVVSVSGPAVVNAAADPGSNFAALAEVAGDAEPGDGRAEVTVVDGSRSSATVPHFLARVRCFGREHLGVLAVIVACALAFASYHLLGARAHEAPLAAASLVSSASGSSGGVAPTVATSQLSPPSVSAPALRIHVAGAVRHPGVVSLPPGARVIDAIQAAGGLAAGGATGLLNLAAPLSDGSQVVIGTSAGPSSTVNPPVPASSAPAATGAPVGDGTTAADEATTAKLNLNTATAEQLDQLPGIGPVTASRIIAWRTQHGRFTSVAELQEVEGIGPKSYAQIAPLVTV